MPSVYKRSRDKGRRGASWFYDYVDHTGKRITRKGFTDRQATIQLAAKLEQDARKRRDGLIDPVSEQLADHRKSKIDEHLTAFTNFLQSGSNTAKHVSMVTARIQAIIDGCEAKTIADITPEKVEAWLVDFRKETDIGPRTSNHYLQALNSFANWMVERKRMASNPFAGLKSMSEDMDIRHKRRALSPEEFAKLVESARRSEKSIQKYDGDTRARIYILSYMTGLRRSEIGSLTPHSFNLQADPPTVTVEAACSKHRKQDTLPLHSELVVMLKEWLKGLPTDQILFPKLSKRRTWLMVKKDLERVGIPYETAEGIADFHAAGRHSHITQLLRNGATLPEAMKLARHSTVSMTMNYTHIGLEDQAKALANLPWQRSDSDLPVREDHSESFHVLDSRSAVRTKTNESPGWNSGSGNKNSRLSQIDKTAIFMEAAGIEPAS